MTTQLVDKKGDNNVWITPKSFIKIVEEYFGGPIPLDPATEPNNPTDALKFFTEQDNGLIQPWSNQPGVFVNPPYSKGSMPAWTKKIEEEAAKGAIIIALLPCGARFSTKYWQSNALSQRLNAICFVKGRLKFSLRDGTVGDRNLYDSQIYGYNVDVAKFKLVFSKLGRASSVNFT